MIRFVFILELLHMLGVFYGWLMQADQIFYATFLYFSPVMIFFSLIDFIGVDYGGRFSSYVALGMVINAFKYGALYIGIRNQGFTALLAAVVVAEIAYLVASGYYIAHLNYF